MFAQVMTGHGCRQPLRYNEQKVQKGDAELIHAGNFLQTPRELTWNDKQHRFLRLEELNKRIVHNMVHISLNFDKNDQLSSGAMVDISVDYMEKLGFGEQPFLVYRHTDAGHPHVHIVSTNLRFDGTYISLFNIGKGRSTLARKAVETKYDLTPGLGAPAKLNPANPQVQLQKIIYGKKGTTQAISEVLDSVVAYYKFCSLPELGAILRLYNVQVGRYQPGSPAYLNGALFYQVLDNEGRTKGALIKSSGLYQRHTLKALTYKFEENARTIGPDLTRLQRRLDWVLYSQPKTWQQLQSRLLKESIHVLPYMNRAGTIYDLAFVDLRSRVAATGTRLGPAWSPQSILRQMNVNIPATAPQLPLQIEEVQYCNKDLNRALTAIALHASKDRQLSQTPQMPQKQHVRKTSL